MLHSNENSAATDKRHIKRSDFSLCMGMTCPKFAFLPQVNAMYISYSLVWAYCFSCLAPLRFEQLLYRLMYIYINIYTYRVNSDWKNNNYNLHTVHFN